MNSALNPNPTRITILNIGSSLRTPLVILASALFIALSTTFANADMSKAEKKQFQQLQRNVQILKQKVDELSRSKPSSGPRVGAAKSHLQRGSISLGSIPNMGSKGAQIALIEFSDYQCPYCARFHAKTFNRIKKKYIDSGKVLYAYRDLPSPARPQAVNAAVAARCAGEQNKYFQMQKILFKNGSALNDSSYVKFAKKLKLDIGKLEACMINESQLDKVEQDLIEGRQAGVRGTPTFFIGTIKGGSVVNATRVVGALPYNFFKQALDKALK